MLHNISIYQVVNGLSSYQFLMELWSSDVMIMCQHMSTLMDSLKSEHRNMEEKWQN